MPRRIVEGVTYTGTSVAPWQQFKEELSSNPFAYFVQCITGHIVNISHREKKAMNFCACIGPIGTDLHCPCKMKELGLPCSNTWTPEKEAKLHAALAKYSDAPREMTELEKFQSIARGLREPNKNIRIVDYISLLQPLNESKFSEEFYQECREIVKKYEHN